MRKILSLDIVVKGQAVLRNKVSICKMILKALLKKKKRNNFYEFRLLGFFNSILSTKNKINFLLQCPVIFSVFILNIICWLLFTQNGSHSPLTIHRPHLFLIKYLTFSVAHCVSVTEISLRKTGPKTEDFRVSSLPWFSAFNEQLQ